MGKYCFDKFLEWDGKKPDGYSYNRLNTQLQMIMEISTIARFDMQHPQLAKHSKLMKLMSQITLPQVTLLCSLTIAMTVSSTIAPQAANAFEVQNATFIGQQTIPNNAPVAGNPPTTFKWIVVINLCRE